MKQNIIVYLVCFLFVIESCGQNKNSSLVQNGTFNCRVNKYLVFSENERVDNEYPLYALKAINLDTKEKKILDNHLLAKCIRVSESSIVYTKGRNLILRNLDLKSKSIYFNSKQDLDIIGISFNQNYTSILLVQANYKTNELLFSVIDKEKKIFFNQMIRFNNMEIEGLSPIIEDVANFFVFLVQDKLYVIDLKKLELKLISEKCDTYALNETGVLYYKFVTDEKTEGYFLQLSTWKTKKIDNHLNDKIYNCGKSSLFTAKINNKLTPFYIICDMPFVYSEYKWSVVSDVPIYKDSKVLVEFPFAKNKIKNTSFIWKLQ